MSNIWIFSSCLCCGGDVFFQSPYKTLIIKQSAASFSLHYMTIRLSGFCVAGIFKWTIYLLWQRFIRSSVPEEKTRTCCPSSQCSLPLSSLVYHQGEAYRASKNVWNVSKSKKVTSCVETLLLCHRRNCIISAYYQQREIHKPTLPNVSMKETVLTPCLDLPNISSMSLQYLCVQGPGGSWAHFTSSVRECLLMFMWKIEKRKHTTVVLICEIWQMTEDKHTGMYVYIMPAK